MESRARFLVVSGLNSFHKIMAEKEMKMMYLVLGVISLFAGMAGVLGIYVGHKKNMEKMRNGKHVLGKKINCEEMTGRPVRYFVEVEYRLDHNTYLKKIVTTDKRIKKYNDNEPIPLLYVDTINKVFWAEDHSKEWFVHMVLLAVFCGFMFSLSGTFFTLYLKMVL